MLDDKALNEILGGSPPLHRVSMVHALRLQFDPGVLQRLLRAALRGRAVQVGTVKPEEAETERLRLLDLLEWANAQQGPVDMELFPAGDYGWDASYEDSGEEEESEDGPEQLPF